jgi:hypothetical protein
MGRATHIGCSALGVLGYRLSMPAHEKHLDEEHSSTKEEPFDGAAHLDGLARDFLPPPLSSEDALAAGRKYVAYTVKLPSEQLAALQSIWLELKRLYGTHSPDKSGMIQQAITEWLRRWDGPDRQQLLRDLLELRQDTRRRQYRK